MLKRSFLLLVVLVLISSCAYKEKEVRTGYKELRSSLTKEHEFLNKLRSAESKLEKRPRLKKRKKLSPVLPRYNPLDEVPIYISVKDQPLNDVLYIIAKNAGLNLVIDPRVGNDKLVTVTFANVPSSVVLNRLMKAFDLYWEVKDNCLYVKALEDKEFRLDFLNVKNSVDIAAGGDVFGQSFTSEGEGESGTSSEEFKGKFSLESTFGKGLEKDSLYNMVLESVNSIFKKEPRTGEMATLDPLTGVLYVKCAPSKMRTIEKLMSELKEKMARQVVIDAQIIEVALNDSFALGIDWTYVGRFLVNDLGLDVNIGWFPTGGLGTYTYSNQLRPNRSPLIIIKDPDRTFKEGGKEFRSTISVLQRFGDVKVVSNPHIRVKHSQPALMVSGKTIKYISEITRDQTEEGGTITYTVKTSSAFEGVMLGVIPFIVDGSTVDLKIFPITSKVDLSNVQVIGAEAVRITLPKVDIRNIATTIRAHNNDTIILGGLIYKDLNNIKSQAPVLGNIPLLGWLFKSKGVESSLKELVVIMHVRIF